MSKLVSISQGKITEIDFLAALGRRITAHVEWVDGEKAVCKGVVSGVVLPAQGSTMEAQLLIQEPEKELSRLSEPYHYELYANTVKKLEIFEEYDFSDSEILDKSNFA